MVPENKLSKRVRRERARRKRETWPINPVTRVKESGKVYSRKRNWARGLCEEQ